MKAQEFLEELKNYTDEEVVILCANRMMTKHFEDSFDGNREVFIDFFITYANYVNYFNDYMVLVCKKFSTEMDEIYKYTCDILNQNWDNESLFNFRLKRLIVNTPDRVLSIKNDDLRQLNLEHMEDELEIILESDFYKSNFQTYESQILIIKQNINIIKDELNEN